MRKKGYAENSTRGNAKMIPVEYKKDVIVQAWVDARKLVVLDRWLNRSGYTTKFISNIIQFTVDEVVEQVIALGHVQKVEYTKDARILLDDKFKTDLNPSGRGERNVSHNLRLDDVRKDNAYQNERSMIPARNTPEAKSWRQTERQLDAFEELKEEGPIDRESRELTGKARIDCKIETDAQLAKLREDEFAKPHVRKGDNSQVMDQFGTFDPNNPADVARRVDERKKEYEEEKAQVAKEKKEAAEAEVKAKREKEEKKAKKDRKKEEEALDAEYEKAKKALAEANDKAEEGEGAYKPRSKEEVDEMERKTAEEDEALYAMDMSGPKPNVN